MTPEETASEKAARDELYRRAANADLAATFDRLGLKLRRVAAGQLRGPCPYCGGEADSTRCAVSPRLNSWRCYACEKGGGPVQAWALATGRTTLAACEEIVGETLPRVTTAPAPPSRRVTRSGSLPGAMYGDGRPINGTPAETWLAARGLDPVRLRPFTREIRFDARAYAGSEEDARNPRERTVVRAPAMLAPIRDNAGELIGVHATYLNARGDDKARLFLPSGDPIPPRKIFGSWRDGAVRLCGALDGGTLKQMGPLYVGEGIETTLSAVMYHLAVSAGPCRAAAVLALANLQGGTLTDARGCADPLHPIADLAAPPWTLRDAGTVVCLIDHDMAPVRMRVRAHPQGTKQIELDATARARMCAMLAQWHWTRANALRVATPTPPRGMDFNDALRAGLLNPKSDPHVR